MNPVDKQFIITFLIIVIVAIASKLSHANELYVIKKHKDKQVIVTQTEKEKQENSFTINEVQP